MTVQLLSVCFYVIVLSVPFVIAKYILSCFTVKITDFSVHTYHSPIPGSQRRSDYPIPPARHLEQDARRCHVRSGTAGPPREPRRLPDHPQTSHGALPGPHRPHSRSAADPQPHPQSARCHGGFSPPDHLRRRPLVTRSHRGASGSAGRAVGQRAGDAAQEPQGVLAVNAAVWLDLGVSSHHL